jgi:hypothetical protein
MARRFTAKQLTFAATSRCPCGAGLAYPTDGPGDETLPQRWPYNGYWDCASILLGTAIASGEEGSATHTARLPFAFYEIKSENQPSAHGASTRPEKS